MMGRTYRAARGQHYFVPTPPTLPHSRCPCSVGIDLKELGVRSRNFAQGLKFKAHFHSKMSVCEHELGVEPQPHPPTIPTLCPCIKSQPLPQVYVKFPLQIQTHTGKQYKTQRPIVTDIVQSSSSSDKAVCSARRHA